MPKEKKEQKEKILSVKDWRSLCTLSFTTQNEQGKRWSRAKTSVPRPLVGIPGCLHRYARGLATVTTFPIVGAASWRVGYSQPGFVKQIHSHGGAARFGASRSSRKFGVEVGPRFSSGKVRFAAGLALVCV